jgi:tetratricopeptide (TPR) repeat protein
MKLSTDPQIEHRLAMAENTVATRLARKMTPSQLIVYYEEKIKRFSKKPHLIEQAGIAAFNLAYHLLPLPNTQDDSIKFYDKAIQMLCNSEDIKNVLWLSMAYVNKGDLLLKLQRYSDAYKTLKDVVSKISAYSDLRIKTQLFMAYAKMTACLAFLNERAELENIIESIKKDKDYRNENLSTDMKYWITLSFENYRNFCRINN